LVLSTGLAIGCATAPCVDGDGNNAPIQIASKSNAHAGLDLAEVLPGDFAQNEGISAEKLTIILFIVKRDLRIRKTGTYRQGEVSRYALTIVPLASAARNGIKCIRVNNKRIYSFATRRACIG
jgi:hypothetical protein